MGIHDWTRVPAGIFHDFHNSWITELRNWLNSGVLPDEYYAVGEQRTGDFGPDVLTLKAASDFPIDADNESFENSGALAVLEAPPKVDTTHELQADLLFMQKAQRHIAIRHVSGDGLIAFIEVVSPANKHSRRDMDAFLSKLVVATAEKIHLLIIDLFPPGSTDPDGLHCEYAQVVGNPPAPKLLSSVRDRGLYAYDVRNMTAYLQPMAIGDALIPMPLFLQAGYYINVDLATTYDRAYQFFPKRFKSVLEST
jgi:hypothetical protein